jgi:hypothetical protein
MTRTTLRRSRKPLLLVLALALLAVAALAGGKLANSSSAARPNQAPAKKLAPAAAATPKNNFGFSKAVQAKIDRLNDDLDSCLLAHGARRVALAGGGWTYTDPGGRPSAACAAVQARVNAYADSPDVRAAAAAVMPAVEAYARCLEAHGVARSVHGPTTAAEQAARAKAHVACGGSAADAIPRG